MQIIIKVQRFSLYGGKVAFVVCIVYMKLLKHQIPESHCSQSVVQVPLVVLNTVIHKFYEYLSRDEK